VSEDCHDSNNKPMSRDEIKAAWNWRLSRLTEPDNSTPKTSPDKSQVEYEQFSEADINWLREEMRIGV
jgi:hypothetical protein